jgi:putative ABC transport system permease protein
MSTLVQDLRYGLRMLAKNPGFTSIALITLVLGIGANSALFTVMRTFMMGPYEFPNAHELVNVWGTRADLEPGDFHGGIPRTGVNAADYLDWREQAGSFEEIALYRNANYVLVGGERPERIRAVQATPGLLPMVGIEASIGRLYGSDDETEPVVVLTDVLWRRMFGGSTEIVGRTITLNDIPHTVIGVLPPEINRTMRWDDVDLWAPLHIDPALVSRGDRNHGARARLAPGVTIEQAQAEMSGIAAGLADAYPDSNANRGVLLDPQGVNAIVAGEMLAMRAMLAAVAFVLVIACLNLANLFLVRTSARNREFAIRAALGAHRARIVRQLLTESALLALIGGALGMLLGNWALDILAVSVDPEALREEGIDLSLNTAVLTYTLLLSLGSAMVFGLGPALRASRVSVNEALKEGAPAATAGPERRRMRSVLVAGQIMIVLPLLVCCGLAIRSAIAHSSIELGFDPERVLAMRIDLPEHRYAERVRQAAFFNELLEAAGSLPGTEGVAVANSVPFSLYFPTRYEISVEGRERAPGAERDAVPARSISPRYFEVLDTTLVRGRFFTEYDQQNTERVAIVNQRMAQFYWPDEDAIGKRLRLWANSDGPWLTVVGVVANTSSVMIDQPPEAELYLPYVQQPAAGMYLLAKTSSDPMDAVPPLREVIARLDKDQPVHDIQPMRSMVFRFIGGYEVTAQALGGLAVIAMVLAGIGLLGVISISVARRTHEIGVRMALGAQPGEVLRVVLRQALGLVTIGLAVGLIVSIVAAHVLSSRFYGVSPRDPAVFLVSTLLLAAVALVACYVPARRATRIDPVVALRYE